MAVDMLEKWGGHRTMEEAIDSATADARVEDPNLALVIAFERAAHVCAQPGSSIRDVKIYGELRHEILKRMGS